VGNGGLLVDGQCGLPPPDKQYATYSLTRPAGTVVERYAVPGGEWHGLAQVLSSDLQERRRRMRLSFTWPLREAIGHFDGALPGTEQDVLLLLEHCRVGLEDALACMGAGLQHWKHSVQDAILKYKA
jgi:hypothetical protein